MTSKVDIVSTWIDILTRMGTDWSVKIQGLRARSKHDRTKPRSHNGETGASTRLYLARRLVAA